MCTLTNFSREAARRGWWIHKLAIGGSIARGIVQSSGEYRSVTADSARRKTNAVAFLARQSCESGIFYCECVVPPLGMVSNVCGRYQTFDDSLFAIYYYSVDSRMAACTPGTTGPGVIFLPPVDSRAT